MTPARTCVCVPTYNERENIASLIGEIRHTAPSAHVLVVDDASPDGTGRIADRLARDTPEVHVLHRLSKKGLGRAYIDAFDWALEGGYDAVVQMDADFSHDPRYLPEMLRRLSQSEVVVGSRRMPGGGVEGWPLSRRLISRLGSAYGRALLDIGILDLTGGFNAYTREALKKIDYHGVGSSGYAFQIEMKYRCATKGLRIEEFPIVFADRRRGRSKMSFGIAAEALVRIAFLGLEGVLSRRIP